MKKFLGKGLLLVFILFAIYPQPILGKISFAGGMLGYGMGSKSSFTFYTTSGDNISSFSNEEWGGSLRWVSGTFHEFFHFMNPYESYGYFQYEDYELWGYNIKNISNFGFDFGVGVALNNRGLNRTDQLRTIGIPFFLLGKKGIYNFLYFSGVTWDILEHTKWRNITHPSNSNSDSILEGIISDPVAIKIGVGARIGKTYRFRIFSNHMAGIDISYTPMLFNGKDWKHFFAVGIEISKIMKRI